MLFLSSLCKEVATFKVMFFMRNIFLLHLNLSPHQKEKCSQSSHVDNVPFNFFQGYAQMTSPIGKDKSPEFGSSSLSGVFSVEWIKKYDKMILFLMIDFNMFLDPAN